MLRTVQERAFVSDIPSEGSFLPPPPRVGAAQCRRCGEGLDGLCAVLSLFRRIEKEKSNLSASRLIALIWAAARRLNWSNPTCKCFSDDLYFFLDFLRMCANICGHVPGACLVCLCAPALFHCYSALFSTSSLCCCCCVSPQAPCPAVLHSPALHCTARGQIGPVPHPTPMVDLS